MTPCGLIIGEKLEDGEPFETETDVLERFRDCGYPAATLKELELMFDADELIIFEFTNPYLDLEQKMLVHETSPSTPKTIIIRFKGGTP